MKILFVDQFSYFGGAQRVLWETLESLDRAGDQYSVALWGRGPFRDALTKKGTPILELPLGDYKSGRKTTADVFRFGFRSPFSVSRLVHYGRRGRVDLFYANGPRTFMAATLAGRALKKPVIWHLHNVLESNLEIGTLSLISRWASRILACSRASVAPLLARRSDLALKVRVVYNPVPHWCQEGSVKEETPFADGHSAKDRGLLFGTVARITPLKGQKCFLMAARIVAARFPETRFIVIGSPLNGDPDGSAYEQELRSFVGENQNENSVRFLPYQSTIRNLLEELDVLVVSSLCPEASPLVLIEAMSVGKPVIAPGIGGIPEMIEDGETGLLFKAGDHEGLAAKMLQLIRFSDLRRELRIKGKERALWQFSTTRFHEIIRAEITQCIR